MNDLVSKLGNLQEKISVPSDISSYQKHLFKMGRDYSISLVRQHLRKSSKSVPVIVKAPKGIRETNNTQGSEAWIEGYQSVISYVDHVVDNFIHTGCEQ